LESIELVSIIMLSFNRVEDTIFSIKALFRFTRLPFELIILDNNSDEIQKQILKNFVKNFKNIKFIESETNLGCARGRVEAVKHAKGEYFLFVDNDIVATPYYLENLIKAINSDEKTVAVCSKVIFPDCLIQFNGGTFEQDNEADIFELRDSSKLFWKRNTTQVSDVVPWVPGGSTLWKAKYYYKFPIDEKMQGSFEDNEVCIRIRNEGYNVRNCPKSVTIHYHMNFKDSQFRLREKKYVEGRYDSDRTKAALKRYFEVHNRIFIFNSEEAVYGFLQDKSRDNIKKFLNQNKKKKN